MSTLSDAGQQLAQLSQGVLFPSETDAPMTPFTIPADSAPPTTPQGFLQAKGLDAESQIEMADFDQFFAPRLKEREGQDPIQRETLRRLRVLVEWMKANLTDLRIFRVGNLSYDVYMLGKTKSGAWEGIQTQTVET